LWGTSRGLIGIRPQFLDPNFYVVAPAMRHDLARLVARVAVGLVLRSARQVVRQAGEVRVGVVAVGGGAAVAQRDGSAPAQVVGMRSINCVLEPPFAPFYIQ
jgi:hypothetical protein